MSWVTYNRDGANRQLANKIVASKSKVGGNMKVLKQVKRDGMWGGHRHQIGRSNSVNAEQAMQESFLDSHFFYDTTRQERYLNGNYTYRAVPNERMAQLEQKIKQQEAHMHQLQADLSSAKKTITITASKSPERNVIGFTSEARLSDTVPIRSQAVHKMTFSPQAKEEQSSEEDIAPAPVVEERRIYGKNGGCGPAWTRGEIERPLGEQNMGSYNISIYTEEQQARLNVDSFGQKKEEVKIEVVEAAPEPKMVGGKAGLGPAWTRGEMERPAGEENMGTWTAAVYTEEQQTRLGIDKDGQKVKFQEVKPKKSSLKSLSSTTPYQSKKNVYDYEKEVIPEVKQSSISFANVSAPPMVATKIISQVYADPPRSRVSVVKRSIASSGNGSAATTNFSSNYQYRNTAIEAASAKLNQEFQELLNSGVHDRSADPRENFWTGEDGQTDGFYEMMTDFYSGHTKHANPTSRLVKQKDNAWESKHTMRKSMAHKAHEIEYVVDPSRADVMQPSKPINYNLAYKDPVKFIDNILETSVEQTTLKTKRKTGFVSQSEKRAMKQEELNKPVSVRRKTVAPQQMKSRMSKICSAVDVISLTGGVVRKFEHRPSSVGRKSVINPGTSFARVQEKEEISSESSN